LSKGKALIEEFALPDDAREVFAHMDNNGMGNFLPFVRTMNRIAEALNIFEDNIVPANPKPPKMQKSPGNRGWYDKSQNAS
jgi:hypothetical protein